MKDVRYEKILDDHSVAWAYKADVALSTIRVRKDASNQIRLDPKPNADTVTRYVEAMNHGDQFPAVMLYSVGKVYEVINGLHRLAAFAEVKTTSVDAYICDINGDHRDVITKLRRIVNRAEGRPLTIEEWLAQGALLHAEGMTVRDAARECYLKRNRLETYVRNERAVVRLAENSGLPQRVIEAMPPTSIDALGAIKNPKVSRDMVLLSKAAGLVSSEIQTFSREVRAVDTDKDKHEVVKRWKDDMKGRSMRSSPTGRAPATQMNRIKVAAAILRKRLVLDKVVAGEMDEAVRFLGVLGKDIAKFVSVIERRQSR